MGVEFDGSAAGAEAKVANRGGGLRGWMTPPTIEPLSAVAGGGGGCPD